MNALTFAPFSLLTKDQALSVWSIWRDPTEPTQFVYQLEGGQVVGRAALIKKANSRRAQFSEFELAPSTVTSSRVDPKPIATRDVLRELPHAMKPRPVSQPRPRVRKPRRRSPYTRMDVLRGLFLMAVLAVTYVWIYLR